MNPPSDFPSQLSDVWPVFVDRYGDASELSPVLHDDSVVVAVLSCLFVTALFLLFSPHLRRVKLTSILTLRAGDNVKGDNDFPGGLTLSFFLLQGAFLLSVLGETLTRELGWWETVPWSYWYRVGLIGGGIFCAFGLSGMIYRWIGRVFAGKEERDVWQVSYLTLLSLWALFLFVPVVLLFFSDVGLWGALGVAFVGYVLFRLVLFVRTVQIFRFSLHYPFHVFLYLCGREIVPLLFVLGCVYN